MSDMEPLRDADGEPMKLATGTYRLEGRDKALWLAGHYWGERDAESERDVDRDMAEEKLDGVRSYAIGLERLLGVRLPDGSYDTDRSREVLNKLAEFSVDEAQHASSHDATFAITGDWSDEQIAALRAGCTFTNSAGEVVDPVFARLPGGDWKRAYIVDDQGATVYEADVVDPTTHDGPTMTLDVSSDGFFRVRLPDEEPSDG